MTGPARNWRRLAFCAGAAASIAVGCAGLMLVPDLWNFVPRAAERWLIEALLQSMRALYVAAVPLAFAGAVVLSGLVARDRKLRRRRPQRARLLLLCVVCLMGFGLMEAGGWALRTRLQTITLPTLPLAPRLASASTRGPLRLVVIGESSARGYPYQPRLSIGQIVAWQLERALGGRPVEVDILAEGGADLETMHRKLAKLGYRPDAMIIYSGHNEFQARYEWSRTIRPPSLLDRALARSSLCGLIDQAIEKNRVDAPPGPAPRRQLVDWPMYTEEEYAERLASFRQHLEAIVGYCKRQQILPILVVSPGNVAGFEPSRSVLPSSASAADREDVARAFAEARAAEGDPLRSMALYRALIGRYPGFAEAHFRLARLLEGAQEWDLARVHYELARDHDGLTIRCPSAFQQVVREVAVDQGGILIDGPAVLRAISPHGILDYNLFHDAQHPSLRGYVALAEAVLVALRRRGEFGWSEGPVPALDPEDCALHFGIATKEWGGACLWAVAAHNYAALHRYDPTERIAWMRRFEHATAQLAAGLPAEATVAPGVGAHSEWKSTATEAHAGLLTPGAWPKHEKVTANTPRKVQ